MATLDLHRSLRSSLAERARGFVEHRYFVSVCFLVYVGVRAGLVLLVPVEPSSDAAWYFGKGIALAQTGTYAEAGVPTAYWPVGYPAALSALFRIAGSSLAVAQFANLIFAAVAFGCLYALTRQLLGDLCARVAVLLLTLYPNHVAYTPLVLNELLFTALLLGGALLCLRNSHSALVAAGIVFGAATLVKPQTILIAPALALMLMWRERSLASLTRAAARAMLIGVVALLVVLPWSWRNYSAFGTFVLVSTNGGMSLLSGNNPSVKGDYAHDFSEDDPLVRSARWSVADQVAADRRASALAWQWIRENPGDFVALIPKKVFRLWAPDGEAEWQYQAGTPGYDAHAGWFRAVRVVNQGFYVVALLLCAVALRELVRARAAPSAFAGYFLALMMTALCVVFSGQSRYHFPVMPFLFAYPGLLLLHATRPRSAFA